MNAEIQKHLKSHSDYELLHGIQEDIDLNEFRDVCNYETIDALLSEQIDTANKVLTIPVKLLCEIPMVSPDILERLIVEIHKEFA